MTILELHVPDNPIRVIVWKVYDSLVLPHSGMWTAYIRIDGVPAPVLAALKAMAGQELDGITVDLNTGDVTVPGRGTFTIPANRYNVPTTEW